MDNLVVPLIVFSVLAAFVVFSVAFLVVRFGEIPGLDKNSWLVRLFLIGKPTKNLRVRLPIRPEQVLGTVRMRAKLPHAETDEYLQEFAQVFLSGGSTINQKAAICASAAFATEGLGALGTHALQPA